MSMQSTSNTFFESIRAQSRELPKVDRREQSTPRLRIAPGFDRRAAEKLSRAELAALRSRIEIWVSESGVGG
jgi:hypothetical protein